MDYRKKIDYQVIRIPKLFVADDRSIEECCFNNLVVADTVSSEIHKNDITGVFEKKSLNTDTIIFTITKCGIFGALPNLGTVITFPKEPLGVGFVYDWKQYLTTYGVGNYTIEVNWNISGASGVYVWGNYELINYSIERLNDTVRIWSEFNSYLLNINFNFTGSGFKDSIRCEGMFGFRKPNSQIKNLIDKGRKSIKTTRENLNSYDLICEPLNVEQSNRLVDFMLLNEDSCFISDHNQTNHSYDYLHFPVSVENIGELEYKPASRIAKLTSTLGDRTKIKKSMYDGI